MATQKKTEYITGVIDLYLGSVVKVIWSIIAFLKGGFVSSDKETEYLVFDFTNTLSPEHTDVFGSIPSEVPYENFVPAVIKDAATLEKAEKNGLLTSVDPEWPKNPGITRDVAGAFATPRVGGALTALNEKALCRKLSKCLQRTISHTRRQAQARLGIKDCSQNARIIIRVHLSTLGGTGPGALQRVLEQIIPTCVHEVGIDTKVVICALTKGNLDTQKLEKADINSLLTLKYLRSKGTGTYVDLVTGRKTPIPFDRIDLFSNQNNNGNLEDLAPLLAHQGNLMYRLTYTPDGIQAQERLIDTEAWDSDEYQDPRCVYTGSYAPFYRDSSQVTEYISCRSTSMLAGSCLQEGDLNQILDDAAAQVRIMKILETEEGNRLSQQVLSLDELGGENPCDRSLAGFSDRISGTSGIEKAQVIEQTLQIITADVDNLYEPLMRQQGKTNLDKATASLDAYLYNLLRAYNGIWRSIKTLEYARATCTESEAALSEKINETDTQFGNNENTLAELFAEINEIRQGNIVLRLMRQFRIRTIVQEIEQLVRQQIRLQFDLKSYAVAQEEVLRPLLSCIEGLLQAHVTKYQSLQSLHKDAAHKADAIAERSSLLKVQAGCCLTISDYLKRFFNDLLVEYRGIESFIEFIRGLFLKKYKSFAILMNVSKSELTHMLEQLFTEFFKPKVDRTSAVDEFKRFPPVIQKNILNQMILNSEGRLLTEGDGNDNIDWTQIASVPSEADIPYLKDLLVKLDRKPGKWHVIVQPDNDTFSLIQLRGQIALTPTINRLDLEDTPANWKKLVDAAVDPVSAIMPGPKPTERQIRRLLTMAIAAELIEAGSGAFTYTNSAGKSENLSEDPDKVTRLLEGRFDEIVFITTLFARKLLVQEKETIEMLQNLLQDPKAFPFITADSVRECLIQADLLLPRIRRFHVLLERHQHEA